MENSIEERCAELMQDFIETEKDCYTLLNFLAQAKEAIAHVHTEDDATAFDKTFYHLKDELNLKHIDFFN